MRDIQDKTDNSSDRLLSDVFNSMMTELENVIISANISLDLNGGPDTNLNMLGQSLASYSNNFTSYRDTGFVNNYILRVKTSLADFTGYYDGEILAFIIGNTNTGPSTIRTDDLSTKNIVDKNGNNLGSNELVEGNFAIVIYDEANDRFEWINENPSELIASEAETIAGTITNKGITPEGFSAIMLTGSISLYAGSTAPDGFLQCNGNSYNRSDQSRLFNVIGTTYGSISPTTFNVPNIPSSIANTINIIKH